VRLPACLLCLPARLPSEISLNADAWTSAASPALMLTTLREQPTVINHLDNARVLEVRIVPTNVHCIFQHTLSKTNSGLKLNG